MARREKALGAIIVFLLILAPLLQDIPAGAATSTRPPGFTDLQGHWAKSQITRLATLGMVKGYQDRTYKPNQQVSQVEALVLITQSAGYTPTVPKSRSTSRTGGKTAANKAVPKAHWGQTYLDMAVQKGLLADPGTKGYAYDEPATRLDIARLLSRTLLVLPPVNASSFDPDSHADIMQNSAQAPPKDIAAAPGADQSLICALVEAGVMTGYPDGTFRPYQKVSRAELAAIISHLIDQGWIKTKQGQRQTGWISKVTQNKKIYEIELTSLSGKKKYKFSSSAYCFKNGVDWPPGMTYGYRCEILLNGSQVGWINLLEHKDPADKPENLRGSIKSVILGDENVLVVNDFMCRDHTLPIAWDAVLIAKRNTNDFKTLKTGSYVDLKISQGQVKEVSVLEVKTLSDTVVKVEDKVLYLKSGGQTKKKPGWFNRWQSARIIDNEGNHMDFVKVDDKVQVTYIDPYPDEIDDEIPLEIKTINKK